MRANGVEALRLAEVWSLARRKIADLGESGESRGNPYYRMIPLKREVHEGFFGRAYTAAAHLSNIRSGPPLNRGSSQIEWEPGHSIKDFKPSAP
jgi:hypothetical protein